MGFPVPPAWPDRSNGTLTCPDKLRILEENHQELAQAMQDAFEDAVLMGVDPAFLRALWSNFAQSLQTPLRPPA